MTSAQLPKLKGDHYWHELAKFCQAIEASRLSRHVPSDIMAKAGMELTAASVCHQEGEHRKGFMFAVLAATRAFASVGASDKQLEPFRHLYRAIEGFSQGSVDPAFVAPVENRRIDPPPVWSARASLALALESRMWAEELNVAGPAVCNAFHRASGSKRRATSAEATRLANWRKQFKKGTVPRGNHVTLFAMGIKELRHLGQLSDHDRARAAADFADHYVEKAARTFLPQVPGFDLWAGKRGSGR